MSFNYTPLEPILVVDPITRVGSNKFAVLQSGNEVTYRNYPATSVGNSIISFTSNTPSSNTIIDRLVLLTVPVRLTFSGNLITTNAGFVPSSSLLNAGGDGPRECPLSSGIANLSVTINGLTISVPLSEIIHPLLKYHTGNEIKDHDWSMSPMMSDQSFNYSDLTGTNLNPLGQFANKLENVVSPRGGFPFVVVSNAAVTPAVAPGTAATAIVDMLITEPLFISPLYFSEFFGDDDGLYNVTQFNVDITPSPGFGFKCWSHNNLVATSGAIQVTSPISSIGFQFSNFTGTPFSYNVVAPTIQFRYITPNILSPEKLNVLSAITYPFQQPFVQTTDIGTVAYGTPTTVSSTAQQTSSVPRFGLIFARPQVQVLTTRCDLPDCYLAINSILVNYGNAPSLLQSCTQQQLFMMNRKNGSNQTWAQFSGLGINNSALPPSAQAAMYGGQGAVLKLEFGTDIQLPPDVCPGMNIYNTLQIQVNVSNMNSSGAWNNIPMSLYVILMYEGSFVIPQQGRANQQIGIVSAQDVLDAKQQEGINYRSIERTGGSFLSDLGNFAGKINDFLGQSKLISNVASLIPHPIAQAVATGAKALGYGKGGCDMEGSGVVKGGKKYSKSRLS